MLYSNLNFQPLHPVYFSGKGKQDVDTGTSRETPGSNEGARPPQKDDYNEEDGPPTEEVDNEQKDRMKKNRETRLDKKPNDQ